jgi:hypothetical protein
MDILHEIKKRQKSIHDHSLRARVRELLDNILQADMYRV